MIAPVGIIPLIVITICAALFVFVQVRGRKLRPGRLWLSLALVATSAVVATLLLPANNALDSRLGNGFALTLTISLLLIAFGALLIRDVSGHAPRIWLIAAVVWLVTWIGAVIAAPEGASWLPIFGAESHAANIIALVGLIGAGAALPGVAFYGYYRSTLAEVGNRALAWLLLAVSALCGAALLLSGGELLMQAGALTLLLAITGATYIQARHHAFDLRRWLRDGLRIVAVLLLTTVVVAIAILLSSRLALARQAPGLALVAAYALIIAVLYMGLRQVIELLLGRASSTITEPATAARKYSQQITRSLELRQLSQIASQVLSEIMGVRRAALILVNTPEKTDGSVALRLLDGTSEQKEQRGKLAGDSPILRRWLVERSPVSQFDIEYSPQFANADPIERRYLHDTGMSAYAPILINDFLIGVLACGTKRDDTPFFARDLDLLATMADQTGVALRNARLVADLRQLNDEMKVLNRGLEATRDQMEKLDAVKTDFITIASHELRTPLAQIRGYIDLVAALNNQGMVDTERLDGMIDNIRRASERMEELIAAMLDVSQLDVKAMDLRFMQTSLESILKLAIEPLADAARQRKLSLVARGLRGLPVIEADMQRLVQAFRNIVVNAIKFTPDGGRIDISAELKRPSNGDGEERVLITIADTGVGINQDDLELIFRKFYRASDPNLHSTGAYKFMGAGPGLGLTIAKGVIEGHGGRIWVESPGHDMESCPGSTFFIELPVNPPESAKRIMSFDNNPAMTPEALASAIDTTVVHAPRD